jgi:hypothetical protein
LDDAHKSSIEHALRQYCATVLQNNLSMLQILMEVNKKEFSHPDALADGLCIFKRERYISVRLKDFSREIHTPRDLLADDLRAELVSKTSFSGIS